MVTKKVEHSRIFEKLDQSNIQNSELSRTSLTKPAN